MSAVWVAEQSPWHKGGDERMWCVRNTRYDSTHSFGDEDWCKERAAWLNDRGIARPVTVGDVEMIRHCEARAVAAARQWTPVGEGLPPVDVEVLVSCGDEWVGAAHLCPTHDEEIAPHEWRDGDWTIDGVLAWQPLPAPWVAP